MSEKTLFSMNSLITTENLSVVNKDFSSLSDAIEDILPHDNAKGVTHPLLIGIDGPVTAGKTYCAEIVAQIASRHTLNFHVIHYDWFMSPRNLRAKEIENFRSGNHTFEHYDRIAYDAGRMEALLEKLQHALKFRDQEFFEYTINPAYDRLTGECKNLISNSISTDSVVVVEGGGVLNSRFYDFFDISIRLDMGDTKEMIKRLYEREKHKNGNKLSLDFVKERFLSLDYHFDNYLRHRDKSYFDFLIDTTDLSQPKLFIRDKK